MCVLGGVMQALFLQGACVPVYAPCVVWFACVPAHVRVCACVPCHQKEDIQPFDKQFQMGKVEEKSTRNAFPFISDLGPVQQHNAFFECVCTHTCAFARVSPRAYVCSQHPGTTSDGCYAPISGLRFLAVRARTAPSKALPLRMMGSGPCGGRHDL